MKKVVLVHGAGGGGWEWLYWLKEFEQDYETQSIDLMPSPGGLESTTFDDYLLQVKESCRNCDVIIGASMGAILSLKAAEDCNPKAIVLVCSAIPAPILKPDNPRERHPPIIKWANGLFEDTVVCLPDAGEEIHRYAWQRWRDESGAVLNAINEGILISSTSCPVLCIIPEDDEICNPERQCELGRFLKADILQFTAMKHLSPLLGCRAKEVSNIVKLWLASRGI